MYVQSSYIVKNYLITKINFLPYVRIQKSCFQMNIVVAIGPNTVTGSAPKRETFENQICNVKINKIPHKTY